MAPLTHLDTHVLIWLYAAEVERLSDPARAAINAGELAVSPIALLELTYLNEVDRLRVDAATILASLGAQLGVRTDETPFGEVVARAHEQTWTRDPFDRLIAAQAIGAGASLVSADGTLQANVPSAVW